MTASSVNIENIYKLNKIPGDIIIICLMVIFFFITIFFVVFTAKCMGEYEGDSNKHENISRFNKIGNFLFNMFCKLTVFSTIFFVLILVLFLIMYGIFFVTTDVIAVLYESIGIDDIDLFKALVGPIITVLILSLSVFGSIISKSYLNKFFNTIDSKIKKIPKFLNRMDIFFTKHRGIAFVVFIIMVILTFINYVQLQYY